MNEQGAFKALVEQNMPIDYVGGTSQGAFMAGVLALTDDYEVAIVASHASVMCDTCT